MHRIVFTGAHGTGKTTVLREMEKLGCNVITEVVRNLSKKGVKINKDGDEKGQTKIFKEYEKLLGEMTATGYISDRCMVDVVAYSMYLAEQGNVSEKFVEKQIKALQKFRAANPDITYCYFPIEFDVVTDGVRDTDEEFRRAIDSNIVKLFQVCGIQPIYVRGSVPYRTSKICRLWNWLNEGMRLYTEDIDESEEPRALSPEENVAENETEVCCNCEEYEVEETCEETVVENE